jgi:hypothetical protein
MIAYCYTSFVCDERNTSLHLDVVLKIVLALIQILIRMIESVSLFFVLDFLSPYR